MSSNTIRHDSIRLDDVSVFVIRIGVCCGSHVGTSQIVLFGGLPSGLIGVVRSRKQEWKRRKTKGEKGKMRREKEETNKNVVESHCSVLFRGRAISCCLVHQVFPIGSDNSLSNFFVLKMLRIVLLATD